MTKIEIEVRVFTIDEFCEAYHISRTTYRAMRTEGKAPKARKINRKWLIKKEDADKWFETLKDK